MIRRTGAAALLLAALGTGAAAQSFKGAELSGEMLMFSDAEDFTAHNYRGSLEFGVAGPFGVQADLSFYDLEDADTARTTTLHLTYDAFALATVGLFHARDRLGDTSATLWGVEAAKTAGRFSGEAYFGFGEEEDVGIRAFGFDASVGIAGNFALTASGAGLDGDGGGVSRLSAGGEWQWGERGPIVYAEVGRLSADSDGSDAESTRFIGLGGRIALGPNRGTTFESRGLLEVLGSF